MATSHQDPDISRALTDTRPAVFWLEQDARPEPTDPLTGATSADLAIVGGGYSGLWTALLAKERDPSRDVVLLEARTVGWAASGRNGGFCSASLTHGLVNGHTRFPDEITTLERLGHANLDEIEQTIATHDIDCAFERTGELTVSLADWQTTALADEHRLAAELGQTRELLDEDATRALVDSPRYRGALLDRTGTAIVDPARLAWGLRSACQRLGVRVYEHTPVSGVEDVGRGRSGPLRLVTPHGTVDARRVALGTGAYSHLSRRTRHRVVPVYDYALMTEPLTAEQLASIGWRGRQGVGDAANLFHYYRLTADNRILWGGYDAVYYPGGRITPERDQRMRTFRVLAAHFFDTFPTLRGLRFTHQWGGVIDTCSRFSAFFGTDHDGRLAYAVGYTGLGVGATRFGAQVMLDLTSGEPTERTELAMVKSRPMPFPPEPLRTAVIELTTRSVAKADRDAGRRNLWLRTLDRFGLGFDS